MNTIRIAEQGSDLSSRSTGRRLRVQTERVASRDVVVLDFDGVRSVSHSFADELLAVLVAAYGEGWFRNHIRVINHTSSVRSVILDAIQHRLDHPRAAA